MKDGDREKGIVQIQHKMKDARVSKAGSYMEMFVGKKSFLAFLKYEILTGCFTYCPGAIGIFLRGIFYKLLFKKVGKGVMFGRGVSIRNPYKIKIGNNVIIDDNVLLDAKGGTNEGIVIEDGVFIGRNSILSCKNGDIILRNRANIGFNCEIFSANNVEIGENTLLAAYVYIVGGGHTAEELDKAFQDQDSHAIGVKIGRNSWLGTKSTIMDGCNVGEGSIIGAGAVVTKEVPAYSVAVGIPAKVVKDRRQN